MTQPRRAPLVALGAAMALAGCAQLIAGTPTPDVTVATTGGGSPPGSASTEPPVERPREIDLDGEDPCALIPRADWPGLGIEQPGERSEEPNFRSPRCFYPRVGDLTLVITEGVEAWEDRTHNVEISSAAAIEGFATTTIWNEVDRRSCYTAVDVSDGQHLLTTALSVNADVDREVSCGRSYQLAESAMRTLTS